MNRSVVKISNWLLQLFLTLEKKCSNTGINFPNTRPFSFECAFLLIFIFSSLSAGGRLPLQVTFRVFSTCMNRHYSHCRFSLSFCAWRNCFEETEKQNRPAWATYDKNSHSKYPFCTQHKTFGPTDLKYHQLGCPKKIRCGQMEPVWLMKKI